MTSRATIGVWRYTRERSTNSATSNGQSRVNVVRMNDFGHSRRVTSSTVPQLSAVLLFIQAGV